MWQEPSEEAVRLYNRHMPWVSRLQRRSAPLLFTWVEWVAVLSLLIYVEKRTAAWPITALIILLWAALWNYFVSFFAQSYALVPHKELVAPRRMVDWLIGFAAAVGMLAASWWFAELLSEHPF